MYNQTHQTPTQQLPTAHFCRSAGSVALHACSIGTCGVCMWCFALHVFGCKVDAAVKERKKDRKTEKKKEEKKEKKKGKKKKERKKESQLYSSRSRACVTHDAFICVT